MVKENGLFRMIGISLIAAFILSACSATVTPIATVPLAASPTPLNQGGSNAEVATNTTAAVFTATPPTAETLNPTAAVPETATPAPQAAAQVIPTLNAYCRKGPGTGYNQITFLLKGAPYKVTGRDGLNRWWQVQAPGNVTCWVGNANVTTQGPVEEAAIVQGPPLPATPAQFVNSFVCNTTLKTMGVSFNWAAVGGVTGYRIYRDGSPLTEVGPTVTSYHDDAPLGVDLVYELEAFNDYGVAARISTNVPACK